MSVCPVCLSPGGTVSACGCNALLHAECLAKLVDHKYKRCKVCLVNYTDSALLASARYRLATEPTLHRLLSFVTHATNAGQHELAQSMLRVLPIDSLPASSKIHYHYERGRVQVLVGRQAEAEASFLQTLAMLQKGARVNPQHKALTLVGLASVLIDQRKFSMSAHYLCAAIQLTEQLRACVAERVMRTVARYFLELGNSHRYVMALRAVNDIVRAEEVDPVRRATVLLELRVGEAAIGECTVDASFGSALRLVRASHRHVDILQKGANVMSQRIKLGRRLRTKTHPEEIIRM